jgi:hypothetical protein
MLFTYAGRVVAILAIVGSAFDLVGGISIITGWATPADAVLHRYYGNTTVGHLIDRGVYELLFAIALGTITEISFNLRRLSRKLDDGQRGNSPSSPGCTS